MDEELIHHGIKGMKWGVRRFQDKSGRLTAAGKKRYSEDSPVDKSPKQTRYDKLYAKYKTLGYSDEKARQTAKGRVNVERTLAVIGGATVAAAIAYASYKYYDANIDRFIAPNKMLQTVHTGDVSNRIKPGNPFYASYTERDNTIYASKLFSHFTDESNITKMYTKDGIKVASEGTGMKIFDELYKTDPQIRNYADSIGSFGGNPKKAYRRFNYSLVVRNDSPSAKQLGWDKLDHDGIHKKFYDVLKKRGYGAVIDVNDSKIESFAYNPVIVFDDQIKHVVSTTKATPKDLGVGKFAKATAWALARGTLNEPLNNPAITMYGGVGLAALGATTASVVKDNRTVNRKVAFVEQYMKEHPNTKLTTAEINRMYKKQLSKKK